MVVVFAPEIAAVVGPALAGAAMRAAAAGAGFAATMIPRLAMADEGEQAEGEGRGSGSGSGGDTQIDPDLRAELENARDILQRMSNPNAPPATPDDLRRLLRLGRSQLERLVPSDPNDPNLRTLRDAFDAVERRAGGSGSTGSGTTGTGSTGSGTTGTGSTGSGTTGTGSAGAGRTGSAGRGTTGSAGTGRTGNGGTQAVPGAGGQGTGGPGPTPTRPPPTGGRSGSFTPARPYSGQATDGGSNFQLVSGFNVNAVERTRMTLTIGYQGPNGFNTSRVEFIVTARTRQPNGSIVFNLESTNTSVLNIAPDGEPPFTIRVQNPMTVTLTPR
ncbi:hypothetical protein WME94_51840 [Sorangium sp. So ce429]